MTVEEMIIQAENEGHIVNSIIVDDHKKHLKSHIFHIFKKGMFKHCIQHIQNMYRVRKFGNLILTTEDVMYPRRMR